MHHIVFKSMRRFATKISTAQEGYVIWTRSRSRSRNCRINNSWRTGTIQIKSGLLRKELSFHPYSFQKKSRNNCENDEKPVTKSLLDPLGENEHTTLKALWGDGLFRQLVNEATDPTALLVYFLDELLLSFSSRRKFKSKKAKSVVSRILKALQYTHYLLQSRNLSQTRNRPCNWYLVFWNYGKPSYWSVSPIDYQTSQNSS